MIWTKILTAVAGRLPWERIAAFLMTKVLGKLMDKAPDSVEKAKVYASRLADQLILFDAVLEDDKIDSDEVKAIKEAFEAWSKGDSTPEAIKKKYLK